jgi:two-component system, LuxR family, response regulator FixJ
MECAADPASRSKPTILVVDDDAAVRQSMKFSLEVEGFSVRTYADGGELLNETTLPRFGCLVIDYHLPALNGLEVLRQLRNREVRLPAIVITSHPSRTVRERAAAAGASIVEKPLFNHALAGTPAVDITESDKAYEITAELPGMDEKNIEVKLANGGLTIKKGRDGEGLLPQ